MGLSRVPLKYWFKKILYLKRTHLLHHQPKGLLSRSSSRNSSLRACTLLGSIICYPEVPGQRVKTKQMHVSNALQTSHLPGTPEKSVAPIKTYFPKRKLLFASISTLLNQLWWKASCYTSCLRKQSMLFTVRD